MAHPVSPRLPQLSPDRAVLCFFHSSGEPTISPCPCHPPKCVGGSDIWTWKSHAADMQP